MSSCKGDVPSLAVLVKEPGATAVMADPIDHRIPIPSVRMASSQSCNPSVDVALSLFCGGSLPYSETEDLRGYPAPLCDEGEYPRDNPLPGQSPMALSQRRAGTVDGLTQTISGVTLPSSSPDTKDPRGYPDPPSVTEVHPRGEPVPGQTPMTLSQRCAGTDEWIPNPFSGGTSPHHQPYDPSGPMAMDARAP